MTICDNRILITLSDETMRPISICFSKVEIGRSFSCCILKEIEAIIKEDIEAKQDKKIGQKMFIRLGIEKELLKLAGVPNFEEWQEQMEHN
ncbi:MAG: hypothetical protein R6W88_18080 [Desulfobacterales bacterium]